MTTWQIWQERPENPDEPGQVTLTQKDELITRLENWPEYLGNNPVLLHEFEAETFNQACAKQHILMGWDPYKPMEGEE